jgi:hypothetical protein
MHVWLRFFFLEIQCVDDAASLGMDDTAYESLVYTSFLVVDS